MGVTLWKYSTSLTVASSNPEIAFPGWRTEACKLVQWSKNNLNLCIKTEPVTAGADATFMQLGNRHRLFVVFSTISISGVAKAGFVRKSVHTFCTQNVFEFRLGCARMARTNRKIHYSDR